MYAGYNGTLGPGSEVYDELWGSSIPNPRPCDEPR